MENSELAQSKYTETACDDILYSFHKANLCVALKEY